MMKYFDDLGSNKWVTEIKYLLQTNESGYIWDLQVVEHETTFISAFVQRLKDQFLQKWSADINNNRKLVLYKDFKHSFCFERYLDIITMRRFRHSLAQIRTGHHDLEIERGRYRNIPRDQRLCKICLDEVEDEYHFILRCKCTMTFVICICLESFTVRLVYINSICLCLLSQQT